MGGEGDLAKIRIWDPAAGITLFDTGSFVPALNGNIQVKAPKGID